MKYFQIMQQQSQWNSSHSSFELTKTSHYMKLFELQVKYEFNDGYYYNIINININIFIININILIKIHDNFINYDKLLILIFLLKFMIISWKY